MALSNSVARHPSHQQNGGVSRNMTGDTLSFMQTQGNGRLRLQFEWINVPVESVDPEMNGTVQTRLCVKKQPIGDRHTVATEVLTPEEAMRKYPVEYSQFAQYEEVPTSGTPLSEVPGLAQSQINLMQLHGLRSAEDLAGLTDDDAAQMGISITKAHKIVCAWLKKNQDEAEMIEQAEAQAKWDAERKALMDRMERLEESNRALIAEKQATANAANQPAATSQPGAQNAGGVVSVEGSEDLPYDLNSMPDVLSGGDGIVDASEPLDTSDPDPLAGE